MNPNREQMEFYLGRMLKAARGGDRMSHEQMAKRGMSYADRYAYLEEHGDQKVEVAVIERCLEMVRDLGPSGVTLGRRLGQSLAAEHLLGIEFDSVDLGRRVTIGGYLQALLVALIREDEGFSGKRPFGNSGWQHELKLALVQANAIEGTTRVNHALDEPAVELQSCNEEQYDQAMMAAISALVDGSPA